MVWIAGAVAFVLLGTVMTVLMCALILGKRADDRRTELLSKLIEPSIRLPFSVEDKIRVDQQTVINTLAEKLPQLESKIEGLRTESIPLDIL